MAIPDPESVILPAEHIERLAGGDPGRGRRCRRRLRDRAMRVAEVPSYANALAGPMGQAQAVQLALGGFLTMASRHDVGAPHAAAIEGAYQLGRGEARSGRTMEALLAAYRIGARVSWRDMSKVVVANGVEVEHLPLRRAGLRLD